MANGARCDVILYYSLIENRIELSIGTKISDLYDLQLRTDRWLATCLSSLEAFEIRWWWWCSLRYVSFLLFDSNKVKRNQSCESEQELFRTCFIYSLEMMADVQRPSRPAMMFCYHFLLSSASWTVCGHKLTVRHADRLLANERNS